MLSLLSSVPLFIFLSELYFLIFYVGLALSHLLLCTFFVLLSPYIFLEHFQRQRTEKEERRKTKGQKKKKDKEKIRTEVSTEVSWWIADLKIDQLNAFRVNSNRDTLE